MLDTKGNIIVQAIYDEIDGFADNGLAPVRSNGKWGYVGKNGNVKLSFAYEAATPFYQGYAWVLSTENDQYKLIDTNGMTVITLGTREVPGSMFHNGLCRVNVYGDYSIETTKYIDTEGNVIYYWTNNYDAPARVQGRGKLDLAEMFAATPYGPMFNNKKSRK